MLHLTKFGKNCNLEIAPDVIAQHRCLNFVSFLKVYWSHGCVSVSTLEALDALDAAGSLSCQLPRILQR